MLGYGEDSAFGGGCDLSGVYRSGVDSVDRECCED